GSGVPRVGIRMDRQSDRQHRATPVGAVIGENRTVHRLDKTASDGEPKAGAGADVIALLRAIEFIEYAVQLGPGNAAALVDDLQGYPVLVPQASDRYRRVPRRILGCVVQEVEERLFEQHCI